MVPGQDAGDKASSWWLKKYGGRQYVCVRPEHRTDDPKVYKVNDEHIGQWVTLSTNDAKPEVKRLPIPR